MNIVNSYVSFQNINFTNKISNLLTSLQKKTMVIGLLIIGGLSLFYVAYSYLKPKKIKIKQIEKKNLNKPVDKTSKTDNKKIEKVTNTTKKLLIKLNSKNIKKIPTKSKAIPTKSKDIPTKKIENSLISSDIDQNKKTTNEIPTSEVVKDQQQITPLSTSLPVKKDILPEVESRIINGKLHVGKFVGDLIDEGVIYQGSTKSLKMLEGKFKNGKLHGPAKVYNEEGNLYINGVFNEGKALTGSVYKNGILTYSGFYPEVANEKSGKLFYPNGRLKYKGQLNANDEFHGEGTEFEDEVIPSRKTSGKYQYGILTKGERYYKTVEDGTTQWYKEVVTSYSGKDRTWEGTRYSKASEKGVYIKNKSGTFKGNEHVSGEVYDPKTGKFLINKLAK